MRQEFLHRTKFKAPVNVTWEVTARCNLHCRHCLSADIGEFSEAELGFEECRALIDTLKQMEVFQVNFGGGEPFMRGDFLDLLRYAHEQGITTCVSTNGTLLTDAIVSKLREMDLLYLQVSLDGATASTNDVMRGPGTHGRIIEAVTLLHRHCVPHVSINTVVTRANFREIGDLHVLSTRLGAKTRFSRFRPSGNGKKTWDELRLDGLQLAELSRFLSAHQDIVTGDSFFSITAFDRRELGLNMCGAARMTCSVLPDGGVYPCAFLHDRRFLAGKVLTESLQSIWDNAPVFELLRNIRVDACGSCWRFSICHGGCPAVAYFLTDALDRPDPECVASFRRALQSAPAADQAYQSP
ncbi:MAG: mycofactocin radical SAM maturase [Syntrophorhabdales bacterium]